MQILQYSAFFKSNFIEITETFTVITDQKQTISTTMIFPHQDCLITLVMNYFNLARALVNIIYQVVG